MAHRRSSDKGDHSVYHELLPDPWTDTVHDEGNVDPTWDVPLPREAMTPQSCPSQSSTDVDSEGLLDTPDGPKAPDHFEKRYETSKYEIWAYYAYFMGNSGLTLFNFAPTAFQNLLSQAAGGAKVLPFAGRYGIRRACCGSRIGPSLIRALGIVP